MEVVIIMMILGLDLRSITNILLYYCTLIYLDAPRYSSTTINKYSALEYFLLQIY